jgi:diguanylate cyclase (GGDEF)-like protein
MILRHLRRYDALLLAGLTTAAFVVFSKPIRVVLDSARGFEDQYGLSLIPALVVLTVVFLVQQQAKRHECAAHAAAAAAEATQARARSRDLEELVNFGRSLAESLDLDAVREATWRHLPILAGSRQTWLLVRESDHWKALTGTRTVRGHHGVNGGVIEAATAIAAHVTPEGRLRGIDSGDLVGFPLVFDGAVIGMLGVERTPEPPTEPQRRTLAASTALLAIAIKNVQLFGDLRDATVHDSLTSSFTRRHTLNLLDTELKRAERSGLPLSVVMLDLDHFKSINDRLGHLAGDAVLSAVGRELGELLRASDLRCRFGGEEFLLVLPDTPQAGAARVAESLRQSIADLRVPWQGAQIPVTASFGVATARRGELDRQALLARADAALYRAKQAGRNCVREHQLTRVLSAPAQRAEAPPIAIAVSA